MPKGNQANISFDQNVTQSSWESLKETEHVAREENQKQTKHSKSFVERYKQLFGKPLLKWILYIQIQGAISLV